MHSLREAAILQGFPADYVFPAHIAKDKLALMIGNAFPPAFTEHHARSIFEVVGG